MDRITLLTLEVHLLDQIGRDKVLLVRSEISSLQVSGTNVAAVVVVT